MKSNGRKWTVIIALTVIAAVCIVYPIHRQVQESIDDFYFNKHKVPPPPNATNS